MKMLINSARPHGARLSAGAVSRFGSLTCTAAVVFASVALTATAGTCTINVGSNSQTIDGFGFSTAWCPVLSSAQADILFGTGGGQLGFSLLRCRIDPNRGWSNEQGNASAAHARGAKVMGTAWTPPASMKSNNNTTGGVLNTSQYANFASFLASAASTIGLDYVSPANEPDITVTYESCTWTGAQLATFAANNGAAVGKGLVVPESFHFDDNLASPIIGNGTAMSHVSAIGGHIYGSGNAVHNGGGKHIWMTEHYINGTDIGTACAVAKEVTDCMNNQMSAYFWWWIEPGDPAAFIQGTTVDKRGYALGQFAKYVRPGKALCSATYNPSTGVYVTAYHNGGIVVVAVNTGTSAVSQTFTVQNASGVTSMLVNRTSGSENLASVASATVSNNTWTYSLPAKSITTFHQF
jgi:glucuronoarabinoxylan endo-1,4-beta-xylanase